MTDFHKLFMVKINKMIKKSRGIVFGHLRNFCIIFNFYIIYVALCTQIMPFMQLLKGN